MSDVIDMNSLRLAFNEKMSNKELKDYASAQHAALEKVIRENKELKEKAAHLEKLLSALPKGNIIIDVTPEELICIEQIEMLKKKSTMRELDLDEVKRFDILNKNLRLIREKATEVIESQGYRNVSEVDLVAIATGPTEKSAE